MEMRFAYNSDQCAMYRVKTLCGFERIIRDRLEHHEKEYRFFVSYKCSHRVKNWRIAVSCGMKQKRRATVSMWRAANKASASRYSTVFGWHYSSQTNASLCSATRDLLRRRLVEVEKIFSVMCICVDDWRSNSKCVGKYSIASSHKGGR